MKAGVVYRAALEVSSLSASLACFTVLIGSHLPLAINEYDPSADSETAYPYATRGAYAHLDDRW